MYPTGGLSCQYIPNEDIDTTMPAALVYDASDGATTTGWRLHWHVSDSGERLPIILGTDGLPHRETCVWATAWLRPGSGSANTLQQALRGPLELYRFADARGFDVIDRVQRAEFMHLHEITAFDAYLAGRRSNRASAPGGSGAYTRSVRMGYAFQYVHFEKKLHSESLSADPATRQRYDDCWNDFAAEYRHLIPRGVCGMRSGLSKDALQALAAFLNSPAAVAAVWPDPFAAIRNVTLTEAMWLMGHRTGEFLNLLVSDIDLWALRYKIERRHDCASDPRADQPVVKGYTRALKLPPLLAPRLERYLARRLALPYAREHEYLFVTTDGRPLSRRMVAKVMAELREAVPALGTGFCPHVLRHTWNDLFTEFATAQGKSDEQVIAARMGAMGWRSRSMAALYGRAAEQAAADEISLAMQRAYMAMAGGVR